MHKLNKKELEALLPKIELMDPNQIKLHPDNPRTLSKKKMAELVKSLESFWQMLFLRPVILDEDGQALGGNQKTVAARKVGFSLIPVIHAKNLSDPQRREFMLKDNVHAGEWDMDLLANNWDTKLLNDWGFTTPEFTAPEKTLVQFTAKVKEPVFDITLTATNAGERDELITRLDNAGFVQEKDYFLS